MEFLQLISCIIWVIGMTKENKKSQDRWTVSKYWLERYNYQAWNVSVSYVTPLSYLQLFTICVSLRSCRTQFVNHSLFVLVWPETVCSCCDCLYLFWMLVMGTFCCLKDLKCVCLGWYRMSSREHACTAYVLLIFKFCIEESQWLSHAVRYTVYLQLCDFVGEGCIQVIEKCG